MAYVFNQLLMANVNNNVNNGNAIMANNEKRNNVNNNINVICINK
jgi:hypothetical protein